MNKEQIEKEAYSAKPYDELDSQARVLRMQGVYVEDIKLAEQMEQEYLMKQIFKTHE